MNIPKDDDLIKILEQPTEIKNQLENAPEPNFQHFEPEKEPEPEVKNNDFDFLNDRLKDDNNESKPLTLSECKLNADAIIDLVDGVACSTFPILYKKRLFGNSTNYQEAKDLAEKLKINKNVEITEDELKIIRKLEDYKEYRALLELQDDEKELIAKPLSQVLYKHQKQASPETLLMIAVGTVYLPKILPLIFAK